MKIALLLTNYLLAFVILNSSFVLHAQVPNLLNYQGRVSVGTTNFDGTGQFKFKLVNAAGSTAYWSNDGNTATGGSEPATAVTLTITKGLYSVMLGDSSLTNMAAISTSQLNNKADVRLRVWFNDGVNGFQLLTPDQRVGASAYAVVAGTVQDGAVTTAKIADGSITEAKLAFTPGGGGGGVQNGAQEYKTAAGTFSFTVPAGVTKLLVELWGGGGGGNKSSTNTFFFGNGGGWGGYSRKTIPVSPGESLTVIVGAGGAGGTDVPGQPGEASSLKRNATTLLASGGGAGGPELGGTTTTTPTPGGSADPAADVGRSGSSVLSQGGRMITGTVSPPEDATQGGVFGSTGGRGYVLIQW